MPLVPTSDGKSRENPGKSPFIIHATRGLRATRARNNFYRVTMLADRQLLLGIKLRI